MKTSDGFRPLKLASRTILTLFLCAASAAATPVLATAYCGDANNDDAVTAMDALVVLRSAIGLGDACIANCECDVDFDREITANDALETLQAAVRGDLYSGCGYQDECFDDEDCDSGYVCGTDPDWSCDAACVAE